MISVEFQRAHRIWKKKAGETRPVIVHFLRFPERELVFKRVREFKEDIDVKVYADYPKEIRERRRKRWPKMKESERGREDGLV